MNYKLINILNNKETNCSKIVIDGFDYYVSEEVVTGGTFESLSFKNTSRGCFRNDCFVLDKKDNKIYPINFEHEYCILDRHLLVVATSNHKIDLPKVVDEAELLAEIEVYKENVIPTSNVYGKFTGFIQGFCKAKENYVWTNEDMRSFKVFCDNYPQSTEDLLELWKSKQPVKLYYK